MKGCNRQAGKLRNKLALMIEEATKLSIDPEKITQNAPAYRRAGKFGIAWQVWAGDGQHRVFSWDTMKQCCKNGIDITIDHNEVEVCRRDSGGKGE